VTIPRWIWIAVTVTVVGVLFWAATSDAVYEATSPSSFSFHVWLRKAYSIVAFALVGYLADKSLWPTKRASLRAMVLVASYSAVIEYAQWLDGSKEGLRWNAIDVVCGAVGGWLGAQAMRVRPKLRA
jgi:hypothetical protein